VPIFFIAAIFGNVGSPNKKPMVTVANKKFRTSKPSIALR